MDAAPQASASKAAETPLLTGFRYPSGKLWMSQELLQHQDEIILSATKGLVPLPQSQQLPQHRRLLRKRPALRQDTDAAGAGEPRRHTTPPQSTGISSRESCSKGKPG